MITVLLSVLSVDGEDVDVSKFTAAVPRDVFKDTYLNCRAETCATRQPENVVKCENKLSKKVLQKFRKFNRDRYQRHS